jgi:hypothetical protein
MNGNFAYNGDFHGIVGISYMPQICDTGLTALLPSEGRRAEDLFGPEKSDGFGWV